MMYSVLIVDDEDVIREGLKQVVSWEALGYHIVGAVGSGEEALRFLENTPVDVVLADIRMPRLSGLELARLIKLNYPDSKVVILSGYDNFSYAQNAIRYGVYHYLLKPCAEEEIIEVFTRLHAEIEKIKARKVSAQRMNKIMIQEEATNLIAGKLAREDTRNLVSWRQRYSHDGLATVAFQLMPDDTLFQSVLEQETSIFPLCDSFESLLDRDDALVINVQPERYLCFLLGSAKSLESEARMLFSELRTRVAASLSIDLMAMCCLHEGGDPWSEKFLRGFLAHIDPWFWKEPLGNIRFVFPSQVDDAPEPISLPDPAVLAKEMCSKKRSGNSPLSEDLFETTPLIQVVSPVSWLQEYGWNLKESVRQCGTEFASADSFLEAVIPLIGCCATLGRVKEIAVRAGMLACETIERHKDTCFSKSIRDALQLIDQRYQSNVTLEDLSSELGLTATYLSKLFKRETGINFKDYLVDKQMAEAKRLLLETNAKIYEIAEAVGFNDQHYFSEIFKRSTTFTPLEYRKVKLDA